MPNKVAKAPFDYGLDQVHWIAREIVDLLVKTPGTREHKYAAVQLVGSLMLYSSLVDVLIPPSLQEPPGSYPDYGHLAGLQPHRSITVLRLLSSSDTYFLMAIRAPNSGVRRSFWFHAACFFDIFRSQLICFSVFKMWPNRIGRRCRIRSIESSVSTGL